MKTYKIDLTSTDDRYLQFIPTKYLLKAIRKKWRDLGGTTCSKNIAHVMGDEYTLIQFKLICSSSVLYKISFTEIE